jgi:hypothetical protein
MLEDGLKAEGIDGLWAASHWPWEAARILRYVQGDVQLLHNVVEAMMEKRQVQWLKRDWKDAEKEEWPKFRKTKPIIHPKGGSPTWLPVRKLIDPDIPEPDRRWMRDYDGKWDLERMTEWLGLTRRDRDGDAARLEER